ncbi:hypothetical protein J2S74_002908 [Evansella vedderi]|uniref:Replication initiation protein n=1 Tax=Evansella vedderi TaxID=38282 RepID=A0ABT9ZWA9_9BACI|nr:hypothetical protein [Evansella vedderi]MDQ0255526.1 hypothetical protein [Evansella vedderi]
MSEEANERISITARIHADLCHPEFLNSLSSGKQIEFLLKCVRDSYYGRLHINPTIWAEALSSSYDTIRKFTHIFISMGVLSHVKKHEYVFHYYRDIRKDRKHYVKLYDFLLTDTFNQLNLPSKRVALYLLFRLSQLSTKSGKPQAVRISINNWYSRKGDKEFPFYNLNEATRAIEDVSRFFNLNTSQLKEKKQFMVYGLKKEYDRVAETDGKHHWMKQFLEEQDIVYCHPFHLKNLIGLYDKIVHEMGWDQSLDIWTNAFFKVNLDSKFAAKTNEFIGRLSMEPQKEDKGDHYSKAVVIFRDAFLKEAIEEYGLTLANIFEQVDKRKNDLEWDLFSPDFVCSEEYQWLDKQTEKLHNEWHNKVISFQKVVDLLYVSKVTKKISTTPVDELEQFIERSLSFMNKLKNKKAFGFLSKTYNNLIEQIQLRIERAHTPYPFYNWLEGKELTP